MPVPGRRELDQERSEGVGRYEALPDSLSLGLRTLAQAAYLDDRICERVDVAVERGHSTIAGMRLALCFSLLATSTPADLYDRSENALLDWRTSVRKSGIPSPRSKGDMPASLTSENYSCSGPRLRHSTGCSPDGNREFVWNSRHSDPEPAAVIAGIDCSPKRASLSTLQLPVVASRLPNTVILRVRGARLISGGFCPIDESTIL